jgi:hypothetical protein
VPGTNRDSLREAILALGPVADGDVPLLAMKLSSTFQQSGLTIQMIEEEIRRLLTANRAGAAADTASSSMDGALRQD